MTTKERLRLHDKQIASMRSLMKEGIEMVKEIRSLTLDTRKDLRALAASQKKTDASLQSLIGHLRGGANGHVKGKL
jgi:hypothetical protein